MLKKLTKAKTKKSKNKQVLIVDLDAKYRKEQLKLARKCSAKFTAAAESYAELVILAENPESKIAPIIASIGEAIEERLDDIGVVLLPWLELDEAKVKLPKEFKR